MLLLHASPVFIYNCTSITGVSKDKMNAEKERERYESKSLYFQHMHTFYNKTYTRSFPLKRTAVIQVKCQVFPKGSLQGTKLKICNVIKSLKVTATQARTSNMTFFSDHFFIRALITAVSFADLPTIASVAEVGALVKFKADHNRLV